MIYAIVTSPLLLLAISLFFVLMSAIETKGPKIVGREIPVHQQVIFLKFEKMTKKSKNWNLEINENEKN
jgi:hypothetical protein